LIVHFFVVLKIKNLKNCFVISIFLPHVQEGGPDANVDPFEKAAKDKSERVAKNELQRLRNIAKAKKVTVPGVGLTPLVSKGGAPTVSVSQDLQKAADLAKKSTASLGKFQEKLPKAMEKKAKPEGQKRKFEPLVQDANKEKNKNLEILEKLTSKKSKLDVSKAVGQKMQRDDREREDEKSEGGRPAAGKRKNNGPGNRSKTASKKGGVKRNRKPAPGKKNKNRAGKK
jgi:regulator of ribosome biosynthesis